VLSEYTDIKVNWVLGRFPNERIISAIERHHSKVHETRILRDRYGFGDGRRTYRVKTNDLKDRTIAPTVRMKDMVFLVEYPGQPSQYFLCKKYGHIRSDCPMAVKSPTQIPQTMENNADSREQTNQHGGEENSQAPKDTSLLMIR